MRQDGGIDAVNRSGISVDQKGDDYGNDQGCSDPVPIGQDVGDEYLDLINFRFLVDFVYRIFHIDQFIAKRFNTKMSSDNVDTMMPRFSLK